MLTRSNRVHLRGPLPRRATCCLQSRSDARQSGPSCTFGGKHAKTAIPIAPGTTEQMASLSETRDYAQNPSMHYEKAPPCRRSRPDVAPPPLRCAVQGFAPLHPVQTRHLTEPAGGRTMLPQFKERHDSKLNDTVRTQKSKENEALQYGGYRPRLCTNPSRRLSHDFWFSSQ